MKRSLVVTMMVLMVLSRACLADGLDLSNMTTQQLNQLKSDINEQLNANHATTSSEESLITSAIKSYVEDYYGSSNVSWAWFDYSYTKDWDYFTMSTHADVKKGNEKTRCDIFADVYRTNDKYQIVYLTVGNDELIDLRNEIIIDPRIRDMLGLSDTGVDAEVSAENPKNDKAESAINDESSNREAEAEEPEDFAVAKLGDRNDTVKEIQNMLVQLDYLNGKADGEFGKRTKAAVIVFQGDYGLGQTGIVTQEVYDAIKSASESVPEAVNSASYTAYEVYSKYESNEIAGDSEFKGKTIEVTGKVNGVGTSLFGTPYVDLRADDYGFNLLQFSFSKNDMDQLARLKEGQTLTIRAKCTGWSIMFVYFDNSEIVK